MARAPAIAPTASLTGVALLSAIASGAVTRLTQPEAAEAIAAGFIEANTTDVVDGKAAVRLTDAGKAQLPAAPAPAKSSIAIDDGVVMPTGGRGRAREAVYPFDQLQVGQSFHVAKTAENPEPAIRLSSSVSGARSKYSPVIMGADSKPLVETYMKPTYAVGTDGKFVKGADGKRVKTGEVAATREKLGEPERDFTVKAVDASDPRGEGARCWRTK